MTDQDADAVDGKETDHAASDAKEPDEDALDGKELEQLESQIDDLKSRVEHHAPEREDEGEGQGHFVDRGTVREGEVDDTIAPPG